MFLLYGNFTINQSSFEKLVSEYHRQTFPANLYISSNEMITSNLNTKDDLRTFLVQIKSIYNSANGNLPFFIKQIDKIGPFHVQIFNVLMGIKTNVNDIIVFSYLDRLMVQLILAWHLINETTITISDLLLMIDEIIYPK